MLRKPQTCDIPKILPATLAYIILQLHMQIGGRNSNELICIIQALKTLTLWDQTSVHWGVVKPKISSPYQTN